MEETVRIKGMVCRRCIASVKDIFMEEGFDVCHIDLGEVTYKAIMPAASFDQVSSRLVEEGFEVLDDKESRIVAKVKSLVKASVQPSENHSHSNLSDLIIEALHMDYDSVSALFTATEGITLEKYAIQERIEQAKKLLLETNLSLTDIADHLGYSSINYFSNQFKKQTGMSPSYFRSLTQKG